MRSRLLRPILVLYTAFATCALSSAQDIPKELQDLRGHTRMIRGFFADGRLEYDYKGDVIGHPQPGSWTLGFVRIDDIQPTAGGFIIEGQRLGLRYERGEGRFYEEIPDKGFRIALVVSTGARVLSNEELSNLIDRIFVSRLDPARDLPDYWQKFFKETHTADALAPWMTVVQSPAQQIFPASTLTGPQFRPGVGGITAPRLIYKTEPKYEEQARHAKYQGMSVIATIITQMASPQECRLWSLPEWASTKKQWKLFTAGGFNPQHTTELQSR